ncbi:CPBP family intramembrane glutamic endopeptidase [Polaribacter sargassicola]|uniref:CPBP family intramembrane glutamic endopeptidase n=1 Tax=Polaribacter sargassicola TaxID=2836891 RepID=UPI001F200770|nr:CPBP family intramembrane glutamic endopeptidase [Polaribacter sp. DS7-9]MCG1036209.1 CPBP family intramembrane metalloprotease [Polaribacter sp. DS7-9]
MQNIRYKYVELIVLFILIPVSFIFNYSSILKLIIGGLGFVYTLYILLKTENNIFKIRKNINWKSFWTTTLVKFLLIVITTIFFVWYTDANNLFYVVLNKPKLWILILLFYSIFSVYPQELIYRTFFFKRYKMLFSNEKMLILMNAILFSMAHLLFKKALVLLLTFIGGILFTFTYKKTNSTLLVSIEHSIYGCWLFTVGMGNMLGFPS